MMNIANDFIDDDRDIGILFMYRFVVCGHHIFYSTRTSITVLQSYALTDFPIFTPVRAAIKHLRAGNFVIYFFFK